MIGVIANPNQHAAVREFFELFKTPWRFYENGLVCQALICVNAPMPENDATVVIVFRSGKRRENTVICFGRDSVPIYCGWGQLHSDERRFFQEELSAKGQPVIDAGYDLFAEVEHLLTKGQPPEFARIPTLDLHIAMLRDIILRHSLPLVEIRPVPQGYSFVACLTHDVDQPRLRHHLGDHTMFGLLYRGLIGSLVDFIRGRRSLTQVALSFRMILSLPFVYLGLVRDPWDQFARYIEIETGAASTFFVIPKQGVAGGKNPKRAARYQLSELADNLDDLLAHGCEIAVHGIDAWRDPEAGREELARVQEAIGTTALGVRMHWLYFDEKSPGVLEQAGFSYDSTVGYNNVIGYRAGTGQVFKPLQVQQLLELPMHIMDTALFFPSYMDLSPAQARAEVSNLIKHAERFGGVLTINWHDRSIAPERLWDDFYIELVEELKRRGAWMPTASDAVAWFRARRAAQVEEGIENYQIASHLPGLQVITNEQLQCQPTA